MFDVNCNSTGLVVYQACVVLVNWFGLLEIDRLPILSIACKPFDWFVVGWLMAELDFHKGMFHFSDSCSQNFLIDLTREINGKESEAEHLEAA